MRKTQSGDPAIWCPKPGRCSKHFLTLMIWQVLANPQLCYMLMTQYCFVLVTIIQSLKKKCKNEFGLFENWIKSNWLSLNYSKTTHCVLFNNAITSLNGNSYINIQNQVILSKNAIRCLGVMLGHKLTWKDHTRLVVENLFTARRILFKLKRHAPKSVLQCVYYYLVYPCL